MKRLIDSLRTLVLARGTLIKAADELERVAAVVEEYKAGLPDHVNSPDEEAAWLDGLLEKLSDPYSVEDLRTEEKSNAFKE